MLRNTLCQIFDKIQQRSSCHQIALKILQKLYNETPFDTFVNEFMYIINVLFREDVSYPSYSSTYVYRSLDFAAAFIISLVTKAELEHASETTNSEDETQTHPFLSRIFYEVIKYHDLDYVQARYHSCHFITLLLKYIGDNAYLDNDICDIIQTAMLDRILDRKPSIRLRAVTALARLQDPTDSECPVIKAYLLSLGDPSAMVRKEVVLKLAPSPITVPKIVERTRDINDVVRLAAYHKCSSLALNIRILDKQSLLMSGFEEHNRAVKRYFVDVLLPKWLTSYDGDFVKFLNALKLDAYEDDIIKQTEYVFKKVMELYFKI